MSPELIEATRREWRELGFFYDNSESGWRFVGSKAGLLAFASLLRKYSQNPKNAGLSEHDHLGPYMYLKLVTWTLPEITADGIAGKSDDFSRLAQLLESAVQTASLNSSFIISDQYQRNCQYPLRFEVKDDGCDPASFDAALTK
jgi:hypothetical protein